MKTVQMDIEVKNTLPLKDITAEIRLEAESKAKEAYVMTLLRHAQISAGLAAELLEIDRWQLSELMNVYEISPFDDSMTLEEFQQEVASAASELEKYKK